MPAAMPDALLDNKTMYRQAVLAFALSVCVQYGACYFAVYVTPFACSKRYADTPCFQITLVCQQELHDTSGMEPC
jgi:hypothetical protein